MRIEKTWFTKSDKNTSHYRPTALYHGNGWHITKSMFNHGYRVVGIVVNKSVLDSRCWRFAINFGIGQIYGEFTKTK